MYLVDLTQKATVVDSSESLAKNAADVIALDNSGELVEAGGGTEIFDEPMMLTTAISLMGAPAVAAGLSLVGVGTGVESVPLILVACTSAPLGLIGWRLRGRFASFGRSMGKSLRSALSRRPRELSSPVEQKALEVAAPSISSTAVYIRSDRAPRYRSRGKHWKDSAYGDSYWQGYMDSIYCDYEDNHLDRPSNYNHY